MTPIEIATLSASVLLLSATAALVIAGRSLNRLQRRAWVSSVPDESGEAEESVAEAVETAFIALGLARQLALILVAVQSTFLVQRSDIAPKLAVGALVACVLYLLFDKLIPYLAVAVIGGQTVLRVGRPLLAIERLCLGPFARLLSRVVGRARARNVDAETESERADLDDFIDFAGDEGLVSESEEALLRGVADFGEAIVREVMTPRVDVVAIESTAAIKDLRKTIAERRLSRIPVIENDLDHVIGIAHLKDLVAALEQHDDTAPISQIVRPAYFVPETKRVNELLDEFQGKQIQLAIVVDEYGGTAGLVTLEDAVEEIVGEIQDEDEVQPTLIELHGDHIVVSGKAEIEDVEEALGASVEEGDFHTVEGLVFTRFGYVPKVGDRFEHGALQVEVLDADERRIHRVRISSR